LRCPGGEAGDGAGLAPAHTAGGGRKGVLVVPGVGEEGGADLTEVGDITSTLAKLLCFLQDGSGQGGKKAENSYEDQKLNEGVSGVWVQDLGYGVSVIG